MNRTYGRDKYGATDVLSLLLAEPSSESRCCVDGQAWVFAVSAVSFACPLGLLVCSTRVLFSSTLLEIGRKRQQKSDQTVDMSVSATQFLLRIPEVLLARPLLRLLLQSIALSVSLFAICYKKRVLAKIRTPSLELSSTQLSFDRQGHIKLNHPGR
ncbi:hypothetical protein EV702DRAFT_1224573 [Suillus placidus]|uniref:Uncharacterized protein n=1 Tax=Suillus placidus TaxID=48579 RepID=A0A9P7A6Q1_9AGAM|nr:hypothetical protein EV702DRAFT_1224573 [Suillus placidus]